MNAYFDLVSFLLMMYTAGIAFYIAKRAASVGLRYFFLSLLLGFMVFFHGIHHLFGYLSYQNLEQFFELGSSILALALAIDYAYVTCRE